MSANWLSCSKLKFYNYVLKNIAYYKGMSQNWSKEQAERVKYHRITVFLAAYLKFIIENRWLFIFKVMKIEN